MPTQIERMVFLLAASHRGLRVMRRRRRRRDHLYDGGQVLGSLMRHLRSLTPIEVALLPRGMIGPTRLGLLIATTGGALRLASPHLAAGVAAVDVAVVAPPAEEEHLATEAADDEAQGFGGVGVHGSERGRQELDAGVEPCDEHLVVLHGSRVRHRRLELALGPSLFWAAPLRPIASQRRGPLLGRPIHPVEISAELRDH
jgi:hypothetical protein